MQNNVFCVSVDCTLNALSPNVIAGVVFHFGLGVLTFIVLSVLGAAHFLLCSDNINRPVQQQLDAKCPIAIDIYIYIYIHIVV